MPSRLLNTIQLSLAVFKSFTTVKPPSVHPEASLSVDQKAQSRAALCAISGVGSGLLSVLRAPRVLGTDGGGQAGRQLLIQTLWQLPGSLIPPVWHPAPAG